MTITRSLLLLLVSVACFFVALLVALNIGGVHNWQAWVAGGLLAFAGAHLP